MRLTRYLKPPQIMLDLATRMPAEVPEDWSRRRFLWSIKEPVLREIVDLMASTGGVGNEKKLLTDLVNRERRASTAVGGGLAIPHVRTMQARKFPLCFARSAEGLDFDAPDGAPVHFFFGVCAPPYDDRLYLEVYRNIARVFGTPETKRALMEARDEHEVIRILGAYDDAGPDDY
ncbi:MAG: PTS sugar transporter subunit IIA [Planctomycetota bacterium]|jgi:mannitol/fructose-specific phosphotransferase system IIA component (Ntr-type)